jgi:hypothetical protein
MPLQATSGAASYDAFGGGVPVVPAYIEEVFSTYLYAGNAGSQNIVNGIDLSTKGGMVWIKDRTQAASHYLQDTVRGANNILSSNNTNAQSTLALNTVFNTDGFSQNNSFGGFNGVGDNYASWTWRKQPKFFDIQTWSGNGTIGRTISHSLGSVPGCIIVKKTNSASSSDWVVYHRSLGATKAMILNLTDSVYTWSVWNDTAPTSTVFSLNDASEVNGAGNSYVAYLFAHDAGGFGLTGTDNVISCGSFTKSGSSDVTVNLGFEPQWILMKSSSNDQAWFIFDTMRGMSWSAGAVYLNPNSSASETTGGPTFLISATGFTMQGMIADASYIYIAIRRGPMKVPTSGTSVFNALSRTGTAATATVSTTILPDLVMSQARGGMYNVFYDRLRGAGATLSPNLGSDAESVVTNGITAFNNTSYTVGTDASQNRINWNTYTYANWLFSRAPSFFDEVCYTGNNASGTVAHNLGVVPELMIFKSRTNDASWWTAPVGILGATGNCFVRLNTDGAALGIGNPNFLNNTMPTVSVFSVNSTLYATDNYVAYLFATCAGVSKVGSYTGNGTTQTIDCGFGAGGARFVLIKRTDATGDWYVYDTARGMTVLTDPYLLLNTTAAESATLGSVTTVSTGFALNSSVLAAINVSGGTYIFLAIA